MHCSYIYKHMSWSLDYPTSLQHSQKPQIDVLLNPIDLQQLYDILDEFLIYAKEIDEDETKISKQKFEIFIDSFMEIMSKKSNEVKKQYIKELDLKYSRNIMEFISNMIIFHIGDKKNNYDIEYDENFMQTFIVHRVIFGNCWNEYYISDVTLERYLYFWYIQKEQFDWDVIKYLIDFMFTYKIEKKYKEKIITNKNIIEIINPSTKNLKNILLQLLNKKNHAFYLTMNDIFIYFYEQNKISDGILSDFLIFSKNEDGYNILKFLINKNHKLTDDIILTIFSLCDYKILELLLEQKIKIEQKYIEELLIDNLTNVFTKNNLEKCIILCLNYDYKLSKQDLIKITKYSINLEEKYIDKSYLQDEEFKQAIENILAEKNMYPNSFGIDFGETSLINLIKQKMNKTKIKQFVKKNKIKPTIKSLREACNNTKYYGVIQYLHNEHKIEFDDECLKNTVDAIQNQELSYIYNSMKKIN